MSIRRGARECRDLVSERATRRSEVPRAPALAPWSATRGARSSSASTGGVTTWKSGYAAASKRFDDAPFATDLRGRHYVITGANQGIGYATAKQLASQNASVHMVCRDRARGEAALAKLRAELAPPPGTATTAAGVGTPGPALTLHVCDVSLQRDVAAFADAYARSGAPLHCLVNNAGCMVHERTATREGVETNFATNTLGAYNLTRLLEPALRPRGRRRGPPSSSLLRRRASRGDSASKTSSPNEKTFDATRAYAKQKRHQMALCERFAEAEEESGKKKSAETAALTIVLMPTEERKSPPGGKVQPRRPGVRGGSFDRVLLHAPRLERHRGLRVALPGFYDALRAERSGRRRMGRRHGRVAVRRAHAPCRRRRDVLGHDVVVLQADDGQVEAGEGADLAGVVAAGVDQVSRPRRWCLARSRRATPRRLRTHLRGPGNGGYAGAQGPAPPFFS